MGIFLGMYKPGVPKNDGNYCLLKLFIRLPLKKKINKKWKSHEWEAETYLATVVTRKEKVKVNFRDLIEKFVH